MRLRVALIVFAYATQALAARPAPRIAVPRSTQPKLPSRLRLYKRAAGQVGKVDEFASERYGTRGEKALQQLRAVNQRFEVLITDAGLMTRLDLFERFVKENGMQNGEPWAVRQAFAKSLGNRVVYRALALSPADYKKILQDGLDSKLLQHNSMADLLENKGQEAWILSAPWSTLVEGERAGLLTHGDPLLSVTDHQDVASAVAQRYAAQSSGLQVYLFKLNIPELDLIYQKPNSVVPDYPAKYYDKKLILSKGDRRKAIPFASRRVESFVMYRVEPGEILSSRLVPAAQVPKMSFESQHTE